MWCVVYYQLHKWLKITSKYFLFEETPHFTILTINTKGWFLGGTHALPKKIKKQHIITSHKYQKLIKCLVNPSKEHSMIALAISSSRKVFLSRDNSKEVIDLLTILTRYSKGSSWITTVWLNLLMLSLLKEEPCLVLLLAGLSILMRISYLIWSSTCHVLSTSSTMELLKLFFMIERFWIQMAELLRFAKSRGFSSSSQVLAHQLRYFLKEKVMKVWVEKVQTWFLKL